MQRLAAEAAGGGFSPGGRASGFHAPTFLVPVMGAYQGLLELRRVDIVEANHALAFLIPDLMPPRTFSGAGAGVAGFANPSSQEVAGWCPARLGNSDWREDGVPTRLSVVPSPWKVRCRVRWVAGPPGQVDRGPPTITVRIEPRMSAEKKAHQHVHNKSILTVSLAATDSGINEGGCGHGGRKAICFAIPRVRRLHGDGNSVEVEDNGARNPPSCESGSVVFVCAVSALACLTRPGTGSRGGRSVGPALEGYGSPGSPPPTVSLEGVPRRWGSGSVLVAP